VEGRLRRPAAAHHVAPLPLEDLERLAFAAYLIGRDDDSIDVGVRAHRECLRLGDAPRAARCAFWLSFLLMTERRWPVLAAGSPGLGDCSMTYKKTA
jgi:hypothetical protein